MNLKTNKQGIKHEKAKNYNCYLRNYLNYKVLDYTNYLYF